MATGHQLWTWPPLGTGAALSCPVISAAWVVWGSWWHEKRRIGASPARVTLIRERAAQSADHLAEKRQKWAVLCEVVCDLGKSGNTANTTTYNSDFPAQHSRQVTTPATRFVHPSAYRTCRVAGFAPCMPWYALLIRTWACYSEPGQPRPRTEQRVNVRNRRPTCETAGSHAGHVGTQVTVAHSQSMTDHGAATHRPATHHSQEHGKHDHLQQRLSRATKPKSHPASNTFCPSS